MTNSGVPFNTNAHVQREVKKTHYDLERTQPVDQLEEGKKWDRKVAEAAKGNGSSKSKRR